MGGNPGHGIRGCGLDGVPERTAAPRRAAAGPTLTRRAFLRAAGAGLAGGALGLGLRHGRILERALARATSCAGLSDIAHVVILVQENRSFDHYYGTLAGVRGFGDPDVPVQVVDGRRYPVFDQFGYENHGDPYLQPFHLRTDDPAVDGECLNDITHDWGPQHRSFNGGRMDNFVRVHVAVDGPAIGVNTMGYYTRADLGFYYALADAFTIADAYHCSVLGPTDPNRLYTVSATLDPDGAHGGPLLQTLTTTRGEYVGRFTWKTMPEVLEETGVSWKQYSTADAQLDDVLYYFKAYTDPASPLFQKALVPQWPADFAADVAAGTLPQVSFVLFPVAESEHPAAPPQQGEWAMSQLLAILTSNPAVWEQTVVFATYDENGGFFDHVPPPTPPPGTPGEYVTVRPLPSAAEGISGPIGLGFRVPLLVISPFTTGGLVFSEVSDHTSLLKFLAARFQREGVTVPNLSAWRDATVSDLTGAFDFASPPATAPPKLPSVQPLTPAEAVECATNGLAGTLDEGATYPVPPNQGIPPQEPGTRRRPSGPVGACATSRASPPTPPATGSLPAGIHGTSPAAPFSALPAGGTAAAGEAVSGGSPAHGPLATTGIMAAEAAALGALTTATGAVLRALGHEAVREDGAGS